MQNPNEADRHKAPVNGVLEVTQREWIQRKLAAARAGLADGTNKLYDEEEWAQIRAAKVAARNDRRPQQ